MGSAAVFALLISIKPEAQFQKPEIVHQLVQTFMALPQDIEVKIRSQGTIRPEKEIVLTSEVNGKITWISENLSDGANFDEGDTLLKLDKRDYELALILTESSLFQARAALEREEAEADLANKEWQRVGTGDASSLTLRKPQLAQARAVLAAAEAAHEQAKRNLERTVVPAPFKGRVRNKMVDLGTNLFPGNPIAEVYATDFLEVRLPIADKDIPFLGIPMDGTLLPEGKRPQVRLFANYGGRDIEVNGYILRSGSEIDPKTRMISLVAAVPVTENIEIANSLKVGMFMNAEISGLNYSSIIIVPRYTVKDETIWVVQDKKLRRKSVEVLRYEDDFALIKDGLEAMDKVLTTRLSYYIDGMSVRID